MNRYVSRHYAQDENTSPDLLAEIAKSNDYLTRQYVASNPNTPTETLFYLGAEFPRELLHNPVFSLLILEDIGFVDKMPLGTLQSILRQQDVPELILGQAGDRADLEIQLSLVSKPTTSPKVLERLTKSKHYEVVESASLHVNLAGELDRGCEQKAEEIVRQRLEGLDNRGIEKNLKFEDLHLLCQLCSFPEYMVHCLVSFSGYSSLLECLASSPATQPHVLERLAERGGRGIKDRIAANPSTSIDTLHLILKDLSLMYRKDLAASPQTPLNILQQLAKDPDRTVRSKVAENLNTPIEILSELTEDSDGRTALNALRNIAIKTDRYDSFLTQYAPTAYVKNSSADESIYDVPPETLAKIIDKHPEFVAEYPKAPKNLLVKLSQHRRYTVRGKVARNPNTPRQILEELAADEEREVRFNVAENPNTPLNVLFKELIRDNWVSAPIAYKLSSGGGECEEVERTRDLLAEESASSLEKILERLIEDGDVEARIFLASHQDIPGYLLMQLANKPEVKVQEAVATNAKTPALILEQLAATGRPEVRQAAAKHPHTPAKIVATLAGDTNPAVRAAAMANPNLSKESIEQILCSKYAPEYPQYNLNFSQKNPDSLAFVLNYYAKSAYQFTRYIVLLQPEISPEILQENALSTCWFYRFAVAQNLSCPSDILQKLQTDTNQLVRAAAIFHLSRHQN